MKIGDIKGESTDEGHEREIEILSWSWGSAQGPRNIAAIRGTPAPPSSTGPGAVTITKTWDKASPKLMQYCASGKTLPAVQLYGAEELAGRAGGQEPYHTITLENAVISSYSLSGPGRGGQAMESITLNYTKIEHRPARVTPLPGAMVEPR